MLAAALCRATSTRCFNAHQIRLLSQTLSLSKGHSKWQNIKDTKAKMDQIRSKKITFLINKMRDAARAGGFDMKTNTRLAEIQNEFRVQSLPLDTFNRSLTRLKEQPEVTAYFEFIGPSNAFIVIQAETDSLPKTRSLVNRCVKKVGHFRNAPEIRKRFDEKSFVNILATKNDKPTTLEEVEESAIELDCEEVAAFTDDDGVQKYELMFGLSNLGSLENTLKARGFVVDSAESRLVPQHRIAIGEEDSKIVECFYTLVQDIDEVTNIFDNIEESEKDNSAAQAAA